MKKNPKKKTKKAASPVPSEPKAPESIRFYGAYGSNLSEEQMAQRCPGAKPIGMAWLDDYRLCFRGEPGRVYLSVEPDPGNKVPLGIWKLKEGNEEALDQYEEYPELYDKQVLELMIARDDGSITPRKVLLYVMKEGFPLGMPSSEYLEICENGYMDFGFGLYELQQALLLSKNQSE